MLVLREAQRSMMCVRSRQKGAIALIFCHAVNKIADAACILALLTRFKDQTNVGVLTQNVWHCSEHATLGAAYCKRPK